MNEKICTHVVYDKTEQKVYVLHNEQPYVIENVESVRYINDAQAIDYKDEGFELENMTTKADLLEAKARRYMEVLGHFRRLLLRGEDLLRLISEKQPQKDFVEEMKWIVRDVKKYLADYEKVLSGSVKSIYEQINSLDEGLRNVAKDGFV